MRWASLHYVGLVVFLASVNVGFMPIGYKLGHAGAARYLPFLVIFGLVMGVLVVLAEPAIHVLNQQVEDVTGGFTVSRKSMMIGLCCGVGAAIVLSMIRIMFDFSGEAHHFRLISLRWRCLVRAAGVYGHHLQLGRRGQRPDDQLLHSAICHRRMLCTAGGGCCAARCVRRGSAGGHEPAKVTICRCWALKCCAESPCARASGDTPLS